MGVNLGMGAKQSQVCWRAVGGCETHSLGPEMAVEGRTTMSPVGLPSGIVTNTPDTRRGSQKARLQRVVAAAPGLARKGKWLERKTAENLENYF